MNTSTSGRVFGNIRSSQVTKIVLLILIIVSIVANGIQGYFIWKQAKAYRNLAAIIDSKSNCDKCPEQVESTPKSTPSPTTTTTKSRSPGSGSDSDASQDTGATDTVATPEAVIPPPPPPAD